MKITQGTRPSKGDGIMQDCTQRVQKTRTFGQKMTFLGSALFVLGSIVLFSSRGGTSPSSDVVSKTTVPYKPVPRPDVSAELGNCTVSFPTQPARTEWTTKPLWLVEYPSSGFGVVEAGDMARSLITGLTGLPRGAKNYHASNSKLKRCHGEDETVTCSSSHPVVPLSNGALRQARNKFASPVIIGIRNFASVFPAHNSEKGNKYRGVIGQGEEESWRSNRDKWIEQAFADWKSVVTAWKDMEDYDVTMYLPQEYLLDREKGPATVQRLSDQLQAAGFAVAPRLNTLCIWYTGIKSTLKFEREYYEYTPGYTVKQRAFMLEEMEKMMDEMADDTALVSILKYYVEEIRVHTRLDRPWKNITAV